MGKLILTNHSGEEIKKKGGLKPDEDGYYKIRMGTIGVPNSSGIVYEATKSVRELFGDNSPLKRRLVKGYLRAEQGHPKKTPGMSMKEYISRILKIEETKICGHIRKFEIVDDLEGPGTFTVFGWIRPAGPYASALKDDFDNPHSNTAFSIRSLVDQRIENGVIIRTLKVVVTWDFVDSPGIDTANKENSVGMEDDDHILLDLTDDVEFAEAKEALQEYSEIGTENEKLLADELLTAMDICTKDNCVYNNWN